ncbi:response regulator transcription factor, partial [Bacillus paranthracis]|nr:response regulator transcription factor [Bacillus paranthracis]
IVMTVRVLIADDHPVVRAGVTALLDTDPDIEIVATAATPSEALAATATVDLDLVLLDLQFSSDADAPSGVDVTRKIRSQPNAPEVLILTNYDTDADILAAVEAGATGYLLKDAPAEDLLSAIHRSARGEGALAPAVATRLMARMRSPRTSLTARELDVLEASAQGLSNAQIAEFLVVSEAT